MPVLDLLVIADQAYKEGKEAESMGYLEKHHYATKQECPETYSAVNQAYRRGYHRG